MTAPTMQKPTPGPWFVRTQERMGEIRDCFVAAPSANGLPYDAEILGDDEYTHDPDISRKLADAALIVRACNSHDDLLAALKEAQHLLFLVEDAPGELMAQIADAISKAQGAAT